MLHVAVSRSSSDGNAIRYVLPVFVDDVMFLHSWACGLIVKQAAKL